MTFEEEVGKLNELAPTVQALANYATSLFPHSKLVHKGNRWVCDPRNFVAFEIRWKRRGVAVVTLRGMTSEFEKQTALPIRKARSASYSECVIETARHLGPAVAYVARAAALYRVGPRRSFTRPEELEL